MAMLMPGLRLWTRIIDSDAELGFDRGSRIQANPAVGLWTIIPRNAECITE